MDTLAELHKRLRVIASLLDGAASEIRDAPLSPTKAHVRRIGEALTAVFEIQHAIYKLRPELEKPYEEPPEEIREANRRLGEALIVAYDLADNLEVTEAVAYLVDFAKSEPSDHHRVIAEREAERMTGTYET